MPDAGLVQDLRDAVWAGAQQLGQGRVITEPEVKAGHRAGI
jgi:hypothetical protein